MRPVWLINPFTVPMISSPAAFRCLPALAICLACAMPAVPAAASDAALPKPLSMTLRHAPMETASASRMQALAEALRRQSEQLAEQEQRLQAQWQRLEEQRAEMQRLAGQLNAMQRPALPASELDTLRGTGSALAPVAQNAPPQTQTQTAPPPSGNNGAGQGGGSPSVVGTERAPEPAERPPEIAANIEEGGVLLPRGTLVITPGLEYTHSSATRVSIEGFSIIPALNIGTFEVAELKRDSLRAFVSARYGITNRFEIEAKVPYLYREDSTRNRPIGVGSSSDVLTTVDGFGLGDVEAGAHYQLNSGRDGWPFLIGNLRFKSRTGTSPFEVDTDPATGLQTELPTGSGFYALQPSVTMIMPTDPAVFYSNLSYLVNFEHDYGGQTGEIDPGDSVSADLGLSLALNEQSSFSLGYSHTTVFKTEQNGREIPNTNNLQVGSFNLGYAYRLSDRYNLNFNLSAGLTEDAPDVVTTFRVPITFHLLK